MMQVLRTVDKANGYCFGDLEERNLQAMMSAAVGADFQFNLYPYPITCPFCHISIYSFGRSCIQSDLVKIQGLIHPLSHHILVFLFLSWLNFSNFRFLFYL